MFLREKGHSLKLQVSRRRIANRAEHASPLCGVWACPVPDLDVFLNFRQTNSRLAIVTRFLCQTILKRRRNRAVKVMVGALSAFTNSNAIGRYARRVKWGSRRLQAVARGRITCMSSHLTLLYRHWDRLYPPVPVSPTMTALAPPSPPLSAISPVSPSATAEAKLTGAPASSNGSKRPARKKGGGGQGGQKKGKGRPKRRQSVIAGGKKGDGSRGSGGGVGGGGQAAAVPTALSTPEDGSSALVQAAQRRRPPLYVSSKAKHEEIFSWMQRTRSKHCKDVINYERFTVRTPKESWQLLCLPWMTLVPCPPWFVVP